MPSLYRRRSDYHDVGVKAQNAA